MAEVEAEYRIVYGEAADPAPAHSNFSLKPATQRWSFTGPSFFEIANSAQVSAGRVSGRCVVSLFLQSNLQILETRMNLCLWHRRLHGALFDQTCGVARDDHPEEPAAKARPPLCRQHVEVLPVPTETPPHPAILPMCWVLDTHPGPGGDTRNSAASMPPHNPQVLQQEGVFGEGRDMPRAKILLLCPTCPPESSRSTG